MCKDTNIFGTGEIFFLFGDENDGNGGRGDVCSMQDDGGDHDGGRGLSDSKRARPRGSPFCFWVLFLLFLGFFGGWLRGGRGECR